MFAVLFYGILLGGFGILAILGALGGWLTGRTQRETPYRIHQKLIFTAGIIDLIAVMILATLDWIIGPW